MIKLKYAKKEDIPAGFESLYEEKNGEWHLTQVEGLKTEADVSAVHEALRKEREDHKSTKLKLKPLGELSAEEVMAKLDRIAELEQAASGKLDEKAIDQIVETRIQSRLNPVLRERDSLKTEVGEKEKKIAEYEQNEMARALESEIRKAAAGKLNPGAVEDAILLGSRVLVREDGKFVTRTGVGVTPGLDVATWLSDILPTKPHWGLESVGGGALGSTGSRVAGDNPFSADGWNLTKQGEVIKTLGMAQAEKLAKAAGTTVGGKRPEKK